MRRWITCPSLEGVKPEIGRQDRLLDRMDHRAVPDLHAEHARLRHADGGELVERHALAVGLDLDRVEQVRRGAAGAQRAQFLLEHAERALHAALEFVDVVSPMP